MSHNFWHLYLLSLLPSATVQVRSLSFNLKDPNNPDLRRNVLAGSISPQQLVAMTAEEMASKEVKEKNKEIREQAAWEVTRSNTAVGSTDQFQ